MCELFLLNVSQAFEKRSCLQMWLVGRKRLRWRPGLLSIAVAHEKAVMRLMHDVLLMRRALFSHSCPFCSFTRMFFFTLKRRAFRWLSLRFDNLNLQLGRLASFHELPCLISWSTYLYPACLSGNLANLTCVFKTQHQPFLFAFSWPTFQKYDLIAYNLPSTRRTKSSLLEELQSVLPARGLYSGPFAFTAILKPQFLMLDILHNSTNNRDLLQAKTLRHQSHDPAVRACAGSVREGGLP